MYGTKYLTIQELEQLILNLKAEIPQLKENVVGVEGLDTFHTRILKENEAMLQEAENEMFERIVSGNKS